MPTEHILVLLREERDRLNRAIEALQDHDKRGSRSLTAIESNSTGRKKRHVSAAARRRMAAAQKKRWAAAKAAKASK